MIRHILITGCSSGLGYALSQLYVRMGYQVFGISRNKPDIEHDNFTHKSFDLSDTNSIKEGLKSFIDNIPYFDLVYLNAGTLGKIRCMKDLSLEDIQHTMDLNVYANKELLDLLCLKKPKIIIGTSSGAAVNGSKGWGAYSLSKSNLNMLFNLYSKEMLESKLLAVAPGVIETPMTDIIRFKIDDELFPSAKTLKEGEIQSPMNAAKRLHEVVQRSAEFESGSFIDVRNI